MRGVAWPLLFLLLLPAAEAGRIELPPFDPVLLSVGEEATVLVPVRVGCSSTEPWLEPVVLLTFSHALGVSGVADPFPLAARACMGETWNLEVPARFTAGREAVGDQRHVLAATAVLRSALTAETSVEGEAEVELAFRATLDVRVGGPVSEGRETTWAVLVTNTGDSPADVSFSLRDAKDVVGHPVLPTPVRLGPGQRETVTLLYWDGPATTLDLEATAVSLRDGTVGDRVAFSVEAPGSPVHLPAPAFVAGLLVVGVAVALRRPRAA